MIVQEHRRIASPTRNKAKKLDSVTLYGGAVSANGGGMPVASGVIDEPVSLASWNRFMDAILSARQSRSSLRQGNS